MSHYYDIKVKPFIGVANSIQHSGKIQEYRSSIQVTRSGKM